MRGGCWDAGQAVEEIAATLRGWKEGWTSPEEALKEIEEALYRNNFGPLLEEREGGVEMVEDLVDRLRMLLHAGSSRRKALAAILVAAYTGDPEYADGLVADLYSPEEADGVFQILDEAARLGLEALLEEEDERD